MMAPASKPQAATLLEASAAAMRTLLHFESLVREHIILKLGSSPNWWRTFIHKDVRQKAAELRSRDRQSPFAARLHYHQLYYCYFDDLRALLERPELRPLFGIARDHNLEARFAELVALRNRCAHGRLITTAEAARVDSLVQELSVMLSLPALPESLSLEDPIALVSNVLAYLRDALNALPSGSLPGVPVALRAALEAPSLSEHLSESDRSSLERAMECLAAIEKIGSAAGYRTQVMQAFARANERGLLEDVRSIEATMEGLARAS